MEFDVGRGEVGQVMGSPAASAAPDPALGMLRAATVGEYEIERELGRGGFATVYLAQELALGRYVAIKVMALELLESPELAERLL